MDDLQKLQSQLKSTDLTVRAAAAQKLSYAGSDAAPIAVELVEACRDDATVADFAVAALEDLGPPPESCLKSLSKLVSDPHPLAAYWAVTLLGRMESKAITSQIELAAVLTAGKDLAVRERAAWALGQIKGGSTDAVAALTQAAQSAQPRLSRLATAALEQIRN